MITLSYTARMVGKCMRRFYEERVIKKYPFVESAASLEGKKLHAALDRAHKLQDQSKLTGKQLWCYRHVDARVDGNKVISERRFAVRYNPIERELKPCDYFAKPPPLYRGDADVMAPIGDPKDGHAYVADYKNGNPAYFDEEQLLDMATLVFLHFPSVKRVSAEFVAPRMNDLTLNKPMMELSRGVVMQQVRKWTDCAREIHENEVLSADVGNDIAWPAQPENGGCSFCPVKTCVFNKDHEQDDPFA